MNAQTEIEPYDPASFDHAAYHGFSPPPGTTHDGWAPACLNSAAAKPRRRTVLAEPPAGRALRRWI
jgi:hypothetical protein